MIPFDEKLREEFGELQGQVANLAFEKGLTSPYHDGLERSMLKNSNLDTRLKELIKSLRDLSEFVLKDGSFLRMFGIFF